MNKGCVWSVQSSCLEVVWTDIDCNDGLLLLDGSITPAGHLDGVRGGPDSSPSLHTHTIHSYRGDLAGIEPATCEPVRQRSYL
ncbi:hypothetical protein R3I94_009302 [Phoxinus phoxinus]